MKDKVKHIKNFKDQKGLVIIEAVIVFPLMFFVLFFILFIGNTYYEQARIDEIALSYAIRGAQSVADPFQYEMDKNNKIPTKTKDIKIEPYRYLLGSITEGGISEVENKISNAIRDEINKGSMIFFKNAKLNVVSSDNGKIAKYNNYVVYSTFSVQVNYSIKFPIKFFMSKNPTIIELSSRAEVPVSDIPEFIRNVDMAIDFIGRTSLGDTVKGIFDKINRYIDKFNK